MGKGEGRRSIGISSKDCSGSLNAHSKGDVDRGGNRYLPLCRCVCVGVCTRSNNGRHNIPSWCSWEYAVTICTVCGGNTTQ